MIVASIESTHDDAGRLLGSCCARVAGTPLGDVALVASCGKLYGTRESGVASATYMMRLVQWFEEELPLSLANAMARRRSVLDVAQNELRELHGSLQRLFREYGRDAGRPTGCSVAVVFAVESLYLLMCSGRGVVHCLDGLGRAGEGYSTTSGYPTVPSPGLDDCPRFDRGILGLGNLLVATAQPLDMRAMCRGLSTFDPRVGQHEFERQMSDWLGQQPVHGLAVACLGHR